MYTGTQWGPASAATSATIACASWAASAPASPPRPAPAHRYIFTVLTFDSIITIFTYICKLSIFENIFFFVGSSPNTNTRMQVSLRTVHEQH